MKIFVCSVCGHIEFNLVPEKCMVCRASKEAFKEDSDAIQKPGFPDRPETDAKHIPKIVIVKECGLIPDKGCVDVHVKVGEIQHPMTPEHFIQYIDYYIDYQFISRVWLSPEKCNPAAALHLNVSSGKLTIVENCTLHGNWMKEADI